MAFVPLVLGVILGAIGAIFVVVSVRARKKAEESVSWPATEGKVLSSTVRMHTDIDDDTHRSHRSYEPLVEYEYTVGGTTLSGRKLSFGATGFSQKTAHEVVDRYPTGATVLVHYNPAKPGEAVLETKAAGGAIFLVAGIAMLALSLGSFCFSFFLMFASISA